MATSNDFLDAAEPRQRFLIKQRDALRARRSAFKEDAKLFETRLERTLKELASYLLAEIEDDDLQRLQERLGYPGLLPIKRRFEARLEQAAAQRRQMEATDDIQHFDFHLSHNDTELDDIRDAYNDLRSRVDTWASSQWFLELEGRGFFEPDYDAAFFDWFWDWRAVSLLMEDLEDLIDVDFATPENLKEAYAALRAEADPVIGLWDDLQKRRNQLLNLKTRYDGLVAAPETLFGELYEALSEAVLEHLDACPQDVLIGLAKGDKHLTIFLKKAAGLEKQAQYLKELITVRIDTLINGLDREIDKLSRKMTKARRKMKYYSDESIANMRNHKEAKWTKRHLKLNKIQSRINGFKRYKDGSFSEDYLWWDVITRGAPGDDLYEVRAFKRDNPTWDWRHHEDPWEQDTTTQGIMDSAADELTDRMSPADDDWGFDGS